MTITSRAWSRYHDRPTAEIAVSTAAASGASAGIKATGLAKSYGSVRAVDGINFDIRRGEIVALLGPNGAGKTTTIDMIFGLSRPDSGTVTVFGASPSRSCPIRLGQRNAPRAGRCPISSRYASSSRWWRRTTRTRVPVDEVLRQTGTADIAGRWASKLSGGQAQRVRFAAALVGDPDLLVLDEPTSGIDVEGRREFWQAMQEVANRGKTIVFATHYLEEADANADRIVLMARGQIVADGPATEIKAKVGSRTIRATLPVADLDELRALPGVLSAERHGEAITLSCSDTDAALGALLGSYPGYAGRGGARGEPRRGVLGAHRRRGRSRRSGRHRRTAESWQRGVQVSGTTHVHYELLRALRNWRTLFLSFALPLVVYLRCGTGEPPCGDRRHLVPAVLHDGNGRLRCHVGRDQSGCPHRPRPV